MYFPFGKDWSTLRKLIWFYAIRKSAKKRQQEQKQNTQEQNTKTTTGE